MKIDTAYTAHLGGRDEQQDAVAILERPDGGECLVVLADGMGGHAGGSLASRTVVETAERIWNEGPASGDPRDFLARIVQAAHDAVNQAGEDENLSPRSTCVLLLLRDGMAHWAHIGDSRLYRFRDGELLGRTRDHSVVQMLLDMGKISEEEMGTHPDQNRLTQSLGGDTDPEPDFGSDEAGEGDGFVLCSDGLWEMVKPDEMAEALGQKGIDTQPDALAAMAFDRAGRHSDNISIAMVRLGGPAAAASVAASEAPTRLATGEEPTLLAGGAAAAAAPAAAQPAARATSGRKPGGRKSGGVKFGLAFLLVGVLAVGAAAAVVRPWEDDVPAGAIRPETTSTPKDEVTVPLPKARRAPPQPESQRKEEVAPPAAPKKRQKKDASRQPAPAPAPRSTRPKSAPDDSTDSPRTAPGPDVSPPPAIPPGAPPPQATPRTSPGTPPDAEPPTQPQTQPKSTPPPTERPGTPERVPDRRTETVPPTQTTPERVGPDGSDNKLRLREIPDSQRDGE